MVGDDLARWENAPLDELIDHIVAAYHRPLAAAIARLSAAAQTGTVARLSERLGDLLVEHQRQEEELVFPWLRSRNRSTAGVLVSLLERDHREIDGLLDALNDAAASCEGRAAPDDFARELDALIEHLHRHFELENHVLFPRALAESRS